MSKVITFSRVFPSDHSRKGQPTWFIENVLASLIQSRSSKYNTDLLKQPFVFIAGINPGSKYKYHTIRSGNRWKVGDWFSPRFWSDKPYHSKQITFAPDIEIKKIWDFEIKNNGFYINGYPISPDKLEDVAENDGLSRHDLQDWFRYPKPFQGQIICWNESIHY